MADDVEIEVDLGGTSDQKMTIVNPSGFRPDYRGHPETLYNFQFGAYGTTWLLVWDDTGGFEGALEEAAGWLADNAPGHIMEEGSEGMQDLYKEAAEEQGLPWPPPEGTDWGSDEWSRVYEDATADLTYTESGYLTSYEWWGGEVDTTSPTYVEAFRASLEDQEDELDDEDLEVAQKVLRDLEAGVRKKEMKAASQLKNKLLR
jgi:hypothetical protein